MSKIGKTNKYILALLVADVALVIFSLYGLFNLRSGNLAEVDRLNSELISLRGARATSASVNRLLQETKDDRSRLDLYFITRETAANFVEEMEGIARRSGVTLKLSSLDAVKDKQPGAGSRLKLNLRVEGDFPKIFHFLKILESMPYRLRFSAVSVVKEESSWRSDMMIDLISYIDK